MKSFLVTTLALAVAAPAYAGETTFVIGSRPWNFSDRSRESHLTIQQRGPDWGKPSSSAGAMPSGAGYPGYPGYPVSSNSYSIGNWVQIDMHVAEGAEGLIMLENHQDNTGDQQSVSDALGKIMETFQTEE